MQQTEPATIAVEIPARGSELAKKYDIYYGSGSRNPFDPAEQMPAHAASIVSLALKIQRRRKERQTLAEVGVWQGNMSRWLLTCLPFATLHMIDPWKQSSPGETWYDNGDRFAKNPQHQFDVNHEIVHQLCQQFAPRGIQHRLPSVQAAEQFADGSLDLIFIDAAHDYDNVKADIHAWKKKVRPGGYLTGHDYKKSGNYFGCIAGINEATAELGLTIEEYIGKVWACLIP